MARLNHGDELIVPNVPAVRMTTRPSTPYTTAIARAVGGAEQEPAAARRRLRARADDREIDRNHRQDARCQIERETADQHEQQDRQRPAALEHAAFFDAVLGVLDERQEIASPEVAACRAANLEAIQELDRARRSARVRRSAADP